MQPGSSHQNFMFVKVNAYSVCIHDCICFTWKSLAGSGHEKLTGLFH